MTSQLQALAKRFPRSMVQQVPVGGGKEADFVSCSQTVEKLLGVVGPFDWSIHAVPRHDSGPYYVVGTITGDIDGRTTTVSGMGEGDSWKSAESDSLKRAARMFGGCGLHLWSGDRYRLDRALGEGGDDVTD